MTDSLVRRVDRSSNRQLAAALLASIGMLAGQATLAGLGMLVLDGGHAFAQSGTRGYAQPQPRGYQPGVQVYPPGVQVAPPGSGNRVVVPAQPGSSTRGSASAGRGSAPRTAALAMDGYCAVCLRDMKQWIKGSPNQSAVYDGKTYLFPGEKQKQMFLADPVKYVPALGGDCVVCLDKMGQRMPGKLRHGVDYDGRFYFFPGEDQKKMFKADPAAFVEADLALGGNCAVCQTEAQQQSPGKPEFSLIHDGMRYWFPDARMREMFRANPAKYKVKPPKTEPST